MALLKSCSSRDCTKWAVRIEQLLPDLPHVPYYPKLITKHSLIEPTNSWRSLQWIMQDTACHRCAASTYFKNELLLRDLGFYFRTTLALLPRCPLHQRRIDSRRRFAQWQRWFLVLAALGWLSLSILFWHLDVWRAKSKIIGHMDWSSVSRTGRLGPKSWSCALASTWWM